MEDFFNSKTTLTPGVAGGLTTLITGVATTQFALPGKWIGLTISFLLALAIFYLDKQNPQLGLRLLFLVLNTLIIFAVAVGANTTGAAVANPKQPAFESAEDPESKRFFHDWFSQ